jgi:hypothetical protein
MNGGIGQIGVAVLDGDVLPFVLIAGVVNVSQRLAIKEGIFVNAGHTARNDDLLQGIAGLKYIRGNILDAFFDCDIC